MLKSKFKFFFMALLCVLSMSCSMLLADDETGEISLELPVANVSRAPIDELTYTVILVGPEDIQVEEVVINDENSNTSVKFNKLKRGNYGLFVNGFDSRYTYNPKGVNADHVYAVEVIPGRTTTVPVTLEGTPVSGTLRVRNSSDGVVIHLPTVMEARYCLITSHNVMTGETSDIEVYDQQLNSPINDYYVNKEDLYYFDATFYKLDKMENEIVIKTIHSNPILTSSGRGEPIKLTVLDYEDSTTPNAQDNKRLIWDAFEEKHPNIKIEREVLFYEPFFEKTAQYVQKGTMPDVFYMWPEGRSAPIHDKKLAKDLMPFLERDGILNDYKDACVDPTLQRGGYIAEIPIGLTTTSCMFVNTKVLKECGITSPATTYEELKRQVQILKDHGKKGIIMANQDDWVMQSCLFSLVLGRFAGKEWAKDIKSGKINFATYEPFKKAVQFIKQMYEDGVLTQESLATPYGEVPGLFANDKGGYLIDGDWRAGAFLTDSSTGVPLIPIDKQESDIELIQFPAIPGEVCKASNSGTLNVGYGMSSSIPTGSAKENAAWELIKWLSGPTVQQRRLDTYASFPSIKDDKLDFSKLEPISKKRSKFYGLAKTVTPVFDAAMNSGVATVLNVKLQELGLGKCTVDQVITAVDQAYKANK